MYVCIHIEHMFILSMLIYLLLLSQVYHAPINGIKEQGKDRLGKHSGIANVRRPSAWALLHQYAPSPGVLCAVEADVCKTALSMIGYGLN